MTTYDEHLKTPSQQIAMHEVLNFLIGVLECSPMTDDPRDWVESKCIRCAPDDLSDAILSTKHLLQNINVTF